jgi:hypothetical protein
MRASGIAGADAGASNAGAESSSGIMIGFWHFAQRIAFPALAFGTERRAWQTGQPTRKGMVRPRISVDRDSFEDTSWVYRTQSTLIACGDRARVETRAIYPQPGKFREPEIVDRWGGRETNNRFDPDGSAAIARGEKNRSGRPNWL